MINRRRAKRKGPRIRDPATPRDNKKLQILRILVNNPRGITRPKIDRAMDKKQEDTELKLVLEEMEYEYSWIRSDSKPYTADLDITFYKIRREGKRTLKELDEFLNSDTELKKLDAFDELDEST